ncbi:MAG: hypothetical protein GW949_08620 [Spirochaetales bacterium]|nr:hypothetical protein [Spirochaetales bacterium]
MNLKMRNLFFVVIFCLVSVGLFSQNAVDLHDPMYKDLEVWIGTGYMEPMPYLRPWPNQILTQALETMLTKPELPGDVRNRAQDYYQRLGGGEDPFRFIVDVIHRNEVGSSPENRTFLSPGMDVSWSINDKVHLGIYWKTSIIDHQDGDALATYQRESVDWVPDNSDFDIAGRNILIQNGVLSHLSFGTSEFAGLIGIGRTDYGPFYNDGIVLSADAPFGAIFGYTWHRPEFSVSMLYRPLTATNNLGEGKAADKHYAFHSLEYRPARWVTLSFFEAMVWGNRLDMIYFVPFSGFFVSQGMGGFDGNSLMGMSGEFKPIPGLSIPLTLFADDVHFNDIVRGDLDTKYKLALEGGISWFPQAQGIPVLERIQASYTAVMPYMYTHRDGGTQDNSSGDGTWLDSDSYNFANYTHLGQNLATGLLPNSDRFQLNLGIRPVSWINVAINLQHIRHGNASEGTGIDEDTATGDLFDAGYDGIFPTFQETTRFLIQDVLETTKQLSVDAQFELPRPQWMPELSVGMGYTFEHITNTELVPGKTEANHYLRFQLQSRL